MGSSTILTMPGRPRITSRRGAPSKSTLIQTTQGDGRGGRTATALRTLLAGGSGAAVSASTYRPGGAPLMELVVGRVVHGVTGESSRSAPTTQRPVCAFGRLRAGGLCGAGRAVSYVIGGSTASPGATGMIEPMAGARAAAYCDVDADLPPIDEPDTITITSWWGLYGPDGDGGCWCRHRGGRRW